jgi:hypothetical protein
VTVPLHDRVKIGTLKTTRGTLGDDNRASKNSTAVKP